MRNVKIIYAIALLIAGFAACKDDDPAINPEGIKGVANDTIQIDYNGKLDLNSLFSIQPAGAAGTLSYSGLQQPQRKDGLGEWEAVNAYSLSGSELTSVTDVRVPDAFYASDIRSRTVTQGSLKVSIQGNTSISEKTIVIVQKNKPALTPTAITPVNEAQYVDGPNGKLLVLKTSGTPKYISATAFNIAPIDFDPVNIRVLPKPGSTYIKAPDEDNPATNAGGRGSQTGAGEYVIAFYCESTNPTDIQAAYDKAVAGTVASAKLYVDVEAVVAADVVGIVANTEDIGKIRLASFWRVSANGRQSAISFIRVKLNNGDTEPYDGSVHGAITMLAGEFDQYMQGYQPDTQYPDWFSNVNLKSTEPLPPIGTEVSFTVTAKSHLKDEAWTVRITTKTLDPDNLPW